METATSAQGQTGYTLIMMMIQGSEGQGTGGREGRNKRQKGEEDG